MSKLSWRRQLSVDVFCIRGHPRKVQGRCFSVPVGLGYWGPWHVPVPMHTHSGVPLFSTVHTIKPWQNRLHNSPQISCCIRRWMKNSLSPTIANLISLTLRCPMEVGWFLFLGSLSENKTHSTLLSNKAWESPFYRSKAAKLPDQGVDFRRAEPHFETEPEFKMEFCQKSHKEKFCFI